MHSSRSCARHCPETDRGLSRRAPHWNCGGDDDDDDDVRCFHSPRIRLSCCMPNRNVAWKCEVICWEWEKDKDWFEAAIETESPFKGRGNKTHLRPINWSACALRLDSISLLCAWLSSSHHSGNAWRKLEKPSAKDDSNTRNFSHTQSQIQISRYIW